MPAALLIELCSESNADHVLLLSCIVRLCLQVKALLAHDPETLAKYERSLLQSFVEDNAMVRWCPSVPSCGRAIRVTGDSHCQPQCR